MRAGTVNVLSAASAHTVAAGATLDLAGFSQTVAAANVGGTVSLLGSLPGTTLTVNGPWAGNGGLLRLGTVLGNNASASDRLVLSGTSAVASGHTRVQIANLDGLGALTSGNGIEVVTALNGASTAPNAFALVGGHVDVGAYEYRLYDGDASGMGENWYLRSATTPLAPAAPTTAAGEQPVKPLTPGPAASLVAVPTYRAEVPLLAGLPTQWRQANLAMLGNLHQRVGDQEVLPNPSSDSPRTAWARLVGSEIDVRQSGAVAPRSQGRLRGLQAGIDLYASASWRAGMYVGRLEGDIEVSGFARGVTGRVGHNSLRSEYLGGYATYHGADGFYADTVVQAGRHRHAVEPLVNPPAAGKGQRPGLD